MITCVVGRSCVSQKARIGLKSCCCEHNQRLASSTSLAFLPTTVLWSPLVHIIGPIFLHLFFSTSLHLTLPALSPSIIIILALFISLYPVSFLSFVHFTIILTSLFPPLRNLDGSSCTPFATQILSSPHTHTRFATCLRSLATIAKPDWYPTPQEPRRECN